MHKVYGHSSFWRWQIMSLFLTLVAALFVTYAMTTFYTRFVQSPKSEAPLHFLRGLKAIHARPKDAHSWLAGSDITSVVI